MQFLNNDMDELMRRAAAAYEPNVTGADWEALEKRLGEEKPSRYSFWMNSGRRFGLVFLFLLASLVCNRYLYLRTTQPALLNYRSVLAVEKVNGNKVSSKQKTSISTEKPNSEVVTTINAKNVSKPFYVKKQDPLKITGDHENKETEIEAIKTKTTSKFDVTNSVRQSGMLSIIGNSNIQHIPFSFKINSLIIEEKEDPVIAKSRKEKMKGLYVGALAGFDVSTVKFNEAKTGFSGGVLAGYHINKRWSIETGLIWSKKSYYAEGKDFNTSKIYLPSHSTVIHADGYCQMFEMPIQLQYRFKEGKKHNWFASVGASSYIMQKEEYDYLYERYNVQYYSNKYYKTSSRHWLSTLNLTAGYQYKAGKTTLRVEPYLKLPIGKMGIGSLPITSAGLQLGITYPLR